MFIAYKTFFGLLKRDWAVFCPSFFDRFLNSLIWLVLTLFIFKGVMPAIGISGDYGAFIAVGTFATIGFFEVANNVAKFIADLEGERSITYYLTLPLPQWVVFARIAISNGLEAMIVSIIFFPISKLLLWDSFSLIHFSLMKFILIYIIAHLFYGFFSLMLMSMVGGMAFINNMWMRIVLPLWSFGCYNFSWFTLQKASPIVAYINLLNPLVYIMEGVRASIFGEYEYVSYWVCFFALIFFTVICGYIGIRLLMKKLDCCK